MGTDNNMSAKTVIIAFPKGKSAKILKWTVKEGSLVNVGRVILLYDTNVINNGQVEEKKFKSTQVGTVRKLLAHEGEVIESGAALLELEECTHPTVFKDMCAECGVDLRKDDQNLPNASVPMVHSIPELKVSEEQAQILGKADEERLLKHRKLVLLVDLDQTLIHTTNDNIPANLKDVYHFQLYGSISPWYHTRLRPGTHKFLSEMSQYYELHICTFGARNYAHMIAMFLDPDGKFFSHRILSRDECFDPNSKTANLKSLFPCGDNMVCIIDDREDVWNYASNLIHVKPYHFFKHTGDINAPPGLSKQENDDKEGFDFNRLDVSKDSLELDDKSKYETCDRDSEDSDCNEEEVKCDEQAIVIDIDKIVTEGDIVEEAINAKTRCEDKEAVKLVCSELANCEENEVEKNTYDKSENVDKEKSSELSMAENTVQPILIDKNHEESVMEDIVVASDTHVGNSDRSEDFQSEQINPNGFEINASDDIQSLASSKNCDKLKLDSVTDMNNKSEVTCDADTRLITEFEAESGKGDEELVELEDDDDYLLYLEEILKKIHTTYFTRFDELDDEVPDMKEVIPEVRSKVLSGTRLVFSGLVPTHVSLEESRAYLVAVSLGAEVTQDLEPTTTHLVAVRSGTAKVNAARRIKGIYKVTPKWLWCCAERWERADERMFPLGANGAAYRHPPAHCASPEHSSAATHGTPGVRRRTPSGRFMDSINPLMTFSTEDIANMDREVEDIFNESDESDGEEEAGVPSEPQVVEKVAAEEEESDDENSSRSSESLGGDEHPPHGWGVKRAVTRDESDTDDDMPSAKFRRGEALPIDMDFGDGDGEDNESVGSDDPIDEENDGDWNMMGAALEREFLSE